MTSDGRSRQVRRKSADAARSIARARQPRAPGVPVVLRSVARVASILDCFVAERTSLPLSAIAGRIGLAKSTTSRFLGALEARGYLVRLANGRYLPSGRFVDLAGVVRSTLDVRNLARPVMERLAQRCGECVTLHALDGTERVCIEAVNVTTPLTDVNRRGERRMLGLGGASLVLMAYQDRAQLDAILPAVARDVGCSRRELLSILGNVRKQGYAVSHGGGARDLSGIAAPVFDAQGKARICIVVLIPKHRVRGRVAALGRLVSDAAADISVRMMP